MTRWIYPGADLNATAFGERARSIVGDIDSLVKARHGTSSSERNEEVERAAEERPFRPVPADKNSRVGRAEKEEERKLRERKRSTVKKEEEKRKRGRKRGSADRRSKGLLRINACKRKTTNAAAAQEVRREGKNKRWGTGKSTEAAR